MNTSTRLRITMPIVPWSKSWFHLTTLPLGYTTHHSTSVKVTQHILNTRTGMCGTRVSVVLLTDLDKRFSHFWSIHRQIKLAQAKDAMLLCEI